MLSGIFDILTTITEFFKTVWDFVCTLFDDLAYIVQLLSSFMTTLFSPGGVLSIFPASVLVLLSTSLGIVVVYKVMGRD